MLGENAQSPASKRRRTAYSGGSLRICPHCGRTFKRTEHLERHIRTHTKEKPFVCHCAAAFARRDLLSRHQRVAQHEDGPDTDKFPSGAPNVDRSYGAENAGEAEADLTAAVSLSSLSVDTWAHQQLPNPNEQLQHEDEHGGGDILQSRAYGQELLSPHLFDGGIEFDPYFREFASFLDGVGLPAEWSPYFNGPEREGEELGPVLEGGGTNASSPRHGPRTRAGTPFSSWLPSAPAGNHLSSHVLESRNQHPIGPDTQPYKVTEEHRSKLTTLLDRYSDIIKPAFRLPSRHALTRYLTCFFEGFHSHMPFIHCPSWRLLDHSLELILGISAIGAQYCFESKVSARLFFTGKTILLYRASRESSSYGPGTAAFLPLKSPSRPHNRDNAPQWDYMSSVETVRALIALMAFATWEPEAHMVREAFALQSLLTHVLKDTGLDDPDDSETQTSSPQQTQRNEDRRSPDACWRAWIDHESYRRAKLIAFSFLHTHSIAYNVYPVLRSNEVNLRLPSSTKEWKASTASEWLTATKELTKQQLYFQEALSLLLRNGNGPAPLDPIPTPLGNYVLLHGLLQRIHIVRDLSLPVTSVTAALPSEEVEKLESALRSWTAGWQQAPESSLDPNNENGPIPFTSSSLLAMAYIRIYLHLGPHRMLDTRDPDRISRALSQAPDIERSDGVVAALLYATHMLSIPVRLGVDRVARSQAFFWSVRHSLASLDCGILLSKWLASLSNASSLTPPNDSEDRILHWVRCIVEEAYTVVDLQEEREEMLDLRDNESLSLAVLKIWAHFFKSNAQWPFINIIGVSLEKYRKTLAESRSGISRASTEVDIR